MDFLRCKPAGVPHDDSIAVFVPFQDRARADAKLTANLDGNGNLPLRGDFGLSQCHNSYYQSNAIYYHSNAQALPSPPIINRLDSVRLNRGAQ